MKKIKWGVIGCAAIARDKVIPGILGASNAELYAVASRSRAPLEAFQKRFGFEKAYVGYEAMLNDPQVDAVYIPLPNSLHMEWTINAARHGKHVLCEKPLALNTEQCRRMAAACEENYVLLMEAFMYRYTDRTRLLRELVSSGELGELRLIDASFRFPLEAWGSDIRTLPELGGGSLYDVGVYPVNFIGMLTGRLPVAASSQARMRNGVDESFAAALEYDNGLIATLDCGFDTFDYSSARVVGTRGYAEIAEPFFGNPGSLRVVTAAGAREIPVPECPMYTREVEDFSNAILSGGQTAFNLDETFMNMQLIDRLMAQLPAV